jgi:hypothetical protein
VTGQRACPPEDIGGVFGYERALPIEANPTHPEHQEMLAWIGPFDPNRFDLEAVNADLSEAFTDKPQAPSEEETKPEAPEQS